MSHLIFLKSFLFLSNQQPIVPGYVLSTSFPSSSSSSSPSSSFRRRRRSFFRLLFSFFDDNVECWKHLLVCHEHKFIYIIYIVYRPNQQWMARHHSVIREHLHFAFGQYWDSFSLHKSFLVLLLCTLVFIYHCIFFSSTQCSKVSVQVKYQPNSTYNFLYTIFHLRFLSKRIYGGKTTRMKKKWT